MERGTPSRRSSVLHALKAIFCAPCNILRLGYTNNSSQLQHVKIVVYKEAGAQTVFVHPNNLESGVQLTYYGGNSSLNSEGHEWNRSSEHRMSHMNISMSESGGAMEPRPKLSKSLYQLTGILDNPSISGYEQHAQSSIRNAIGPYREDSRQQLTASSESKSLNQLNVAWSKDVSTEDPSTTPKIPKARPHPGRRAFSDTHVVRPGIAEHSAVSQSSASTPLDYFKRRHEPEILLEEPADSLRDANTHVQEPSHQSLRIPREPQSSLQHRFVKSMQRFRNPGMEAHRWTPNRVSPLRYTPLRSEASSSLGVRASASTAGGISLEQPSADTHNSSDTPPSFRVPVAVPVPDYFYVHEQSHLDFDVPDHLENSPLCPANPRGRLKGKGWCHIHGAGPSEVLFMTCGGLESARLPTSEIDGNLSLAQHLSDRGFSQVSSLEGNESVRESRKGSRFLFHELSPPIGRLGQHCSGVDILNLASKANNYPLTTTEPSKQRFFHAEQHIH